MDSPTVPGLAPLQDNGGDSSTDEAPIPPPKDYISPLKDSKLLNVPQRPGPAPLLRTLKSASSLKKANGPSETSLDPDRHLVPPSQSTPDLSLTRSGTSDGTSSSTTTLAAPISAALTDPQRVSPRPWDKDQAEPSRGHRRWISDGSGLPDRARARRRADTPEIGCPVKAAKAAKEAARQEESDRQALEVLPRGLRPYHAAAELSVDDAASLQDQAYRQAERFEVLRMEDVEALTREIRKLDEWTGRIRREYASLRATRRNLHSRIRQYLSSPRVGRFSFESILKQEERLADLDAEIDDCVAELDRVENRRARVRQKLLEHVAAASLLPTSTTTPRPDGGASALPSPAPRDISTPPRSPASEADIIDDYGDYESSPGVGDPEPPSLNQPDPKFKRQALVELEPVLESEPQPGPGPEPEPESESEPEPQPEPSLEPQPEPLEPQSEPMPERELRRPSDGRVSVMSPRRPGVESIRVYMGGDVFTLLADVENEFSKLNDGQGSNMMNNNTSQDDSFSPRKAATRPSSSVYSPASWLVTPRTPACWPPETADRTSPWPSSNSHQVRDGKTESRRSPSAPPPPTPPLKDFAQTEATPTLLTSAVFKP